MPDVFLSYSREDQPTARRFAEELHREGFTVWWDQALSAGEAFDKVTEQALDEAKAVVVLWSKRSVDSRWVRAEATQALVGNRLVPVMIESCRRPIMFELTHSADFSDWDGDPDEDRWRRFVDGLRKLVNSPGPIAGSGPGESVPVIAPPRRSRRRKIGWTTAAVVAAFSAIVAGLGVRTIFMQRAAQSSVGPLHLSLSFPDLPATFPMGTQHVAIPADGSRIAFAGTKGVKIRALKDNKFVTLDVECSNPFFSPDATWLGMFCQQGLVKVPVTGGAPFVIAPTPERAVGASWSSKGWIVFANTAGLFRVADTGGTPEIIVRPDARRHERLYAWPELLPGDRFLLYTVFFDDLDAPPQIVQLDLQTRETRVVLTAGSAARYVPTGHLVYATGQQLHVVPFDAEAGRTVGPPVLVPDLVVATTRDDGAAEFALADNGTLVSIAPGVAPLINSSLVWVDRSGTETPAALEAGPYQYPRISPDGTRVALTVRGDGNRDIWIWEPRRSSLTRLTSSPSEELLPVWNLDGSRIFFSSNRRGSMDIYSQAADGSDEARVELAAPGEQFPHSISPDSTQLIFSENYHDIGVLDLGREAHALLHNDHEHWLSALSPDGRWLAYESKEAGGQTEIYLRPFPDVNARREKVSIEGGRYPMWGRTGSNELYYLSPKGEMVSAAVTLRPALRLGKVAKLFEWEAPPPTISGRLFDVSPIDGRFLMARSIPQQTVEATQIGVVLNWFDDLRRLQP